MNQSRWQPLKEWMKRRRWFLLSGGILGGIFVLAYFFIFSSHPAPFPTDPTESILQTASESKSQEASYTVIEGFIKEGSTLFKSLAEKNISSRWIDLVVSKLKPYVNFKKIKGGAYRFITDEKGELVRFVYEVSPVEVYEVERGAEGYRVQKKEIQLETTLVKVVGEIQSSLFEAMDVIGEQDSLTTSFAEILAWEIDFYKDVREGDRFKVVVEKIYKGNQFIKYGQIHAVEYQQREKVIRGIEFRNDFFNENGASLRKTFLKAPLRFNRISSKFSRARKHPILGGVRPHFGVDYAAPPGSQVWAVADGKVISCGWNEGYGKQVVLRHRNGYSTFYGHLSGYASGIRVGATVRQKQVIGYVGSTGLSTGPHLDYRLVKDGRFKNPLRESFPAGTPIEKGEMETFGKRKEDMLHWLQGDVLYQKKL